jgi:hypothetical protein
MSWEIKAGSRKVVLTKWMLVIFTVITAAYMVLSIVHHRPLPDSFYLNFVVGLGAIGGAFTVGNVFEHLSQRGRIVGSESQTEGATTTNPDSGKK